MKNMHHKGIDYIVLSCSSDLCDFDGYKIST